MRVAAAISLTEDQVQLAAAGKQDLEITAEIGISNQKAARWRKRYLEMGLVGLEKDAPRPGRTPSIPKTCGPQKLMLPLSRH